MTHVNFQSFWKPFTAPRELGHFSISDVKGKYLQTYRVAINQSMIKNKRTKDTLLSQTLKVEEYKVSSVFQIFTQGLRYSQEMAILYIEAQEVDESKNKANYAFSNFES